MDTLEKIIASGTKLTPMMEQYFSIKKQIQDEDTLLLFRMGDFYELFFEDAKLASKLLNITLTHRGKLGDTPIPMSGIPHHAASNYIDRLTSQGYKAAICEQVEDPKATKGIVKRAITQISSPSLPFDLEKTKDSDHRFIACAFEKDKKFFLSLIDFTTGAFLGFQNKSIDELLEKVMLYSPKEFLSFLGQWDNHPDFDERLKAMDTLKTHLSQDYFKVKDCALYIEKLIPSFKRDETLKMNEGILPSIAALSYYITSTQALDDLIHIKPFQMVVESGLMKVTLPTLRGLEILPKGQGSYKDSLLGYCDRTKTAMGSRGLKTLFCHPLSDLEEIQSRQSMVKFFLQDTETHETIRTELSEVRDIERILSKVTSGKITASDLVNLSQAIRTQEKIAPLLKKFKTSFFKPFSKKTVTVLDSLACKVEKTINDEIGASLDKGNLIREKASRERDRLAKLCKNSGEALVELEQKYRKKTGISKLKIKSNNVNGYFIEVSKSHLAKVPKNFERRQTLVNSERFITPELEKFEKEVLSSQDKLQKLERKIFNEVVAMVAELSKYLQDLAQYFTYVDIYQSLAWVAFQENFTAPEIHPTKKQMHITQGWHPLIKSNLKDEFIPHDLTLTNKTYFGLITGPNMAGKTTVMREMAIIQLLAQIGSYVPAEKATLGTCDYLFSRLGASDDILRGQSTFMVEMSETAEIIRHATNKSLIIMDEVGRGTSTYDGLSIAYSLVEHFVNKTKALTLFSTHYHELIDLVIDLKGAKNLTVQTESKNGDVQFLYNLIEQGANQSYGIYVAKLAGLPKSILNRSQDILNKLETDQVNREKIEVAQSNIISAESAPRGVQLCFLTDDVCAENVVPEHLKKIEKDLQDLDVMNMTPIEALAKLHDLQKRSILH